MFCSLCSMPLCRLPMLLTNSPGFSPCIRAATSFTTIPEQAKATFISQMQGDGVESDELREMLNDPHFNIFYNANTLLVILAKPAGLNPDEDCFLAAQNFMLAAHAQGVGTCPIGFVGRG